MSETFKHQRNISLITLEGLRDFVNSKTPFEYSFMLVGFTARGIPHYQMLIEAKGDTYIFVASNIRRAGPKIRLLNLDIGVVKLHQEFGRCEPLQVYVDAENACEPHVL